MLSRRREGVAATRIHPADKKKSTDLVRPENVECQRHRSPHTATPALTATPAHTATPAPIDSA